MKPQATNPPLISHSIKRISHSNPPQPSHPPSRSRTKQSCPDPMLTVSIMQPTIGTQHARRAAPGKESHKSRECGAEEGGGQAGSHTLDAAMPFCFTRSLHFFFLLFLRSPSNDSVYPVNVRHHQVISGARCGCCALMLLRVNV